ncbi:MAG: alanine--tRNA ligase [Firmicutes bacterium]|nr:alanine--tRNA ligase [Bacillota bacterium]
MMKSDELRNLYLKFFADRNHAVIPSYSLVPENDPNVLFTTAGMHPLIPYLLGESHPAGDKLVNFQKCVRTGDIDSVGDTSHLTFFEMLGNWSLGSYFKNESIRYSFEFLTSSKYLNIPVSKLWVTVFEGNETAPRDDEAAEIWMSLGIPKERIIFLSEEHNWWAVGEEGPCGPDTEIFVEMKGHPCSDKCLPGVCKCGRFFEVWNNVFMTYMKKNGKLSYLPKKNIDTGMGLERIVAGLNRLRSVYETDLFSDIINAIIENSGFSQAEIDNNEHLLKSLRIVADHMRTSVFILGDENSVLPSNLGRGYVLRRLIRRCYRYMQNLKVKEGAVEAIVNTIINKYKGYYGTLESSREMIITELNKEIDKFKNTLSKGLSLLTKEIQKLKANHLTEMPTELVFKLYDTYGFPIEDTIELLSENNISANSKEVEVLKERHRNVSKGQSAKSGLADLSDESIKYHTATHLMHAALRKILGEGVKQKGSNISNERMRFDFSYDKPLTDEEVLAVETIVNNAIKAEIPVVCEVMKYEEAVKSGAIGLFTDKYDSEVKVYSIGDISKELCAGPHVNNTKELRTLKIVQQQAVAAGVRRIKARFVD